MKYKVIIVNGKAGVGKSTFVSLLKKRYHYVLEISMIDPAKEVMKLMGKDPEYKTPQTRAFLCDLKNLLDRYFNMSIKNVIKKINNYAYELEQYEINSFIVVIHSREKNDIKQLKRMFDAATVLIESENRGVSIEDASNSADADIYNTHYDYTVYNNGDIKEFEEEIEEFLKQWK